jgi:hypothetical protein
MSANSSKDLGSWMEDRVRELGLQWQDVADFSGITRQGLGLIRSGATSRPNRATKSALEEALRWMPGSIDSIRAGGRPANMPEPQPVEGADVEDKEGADAEEGDPFAEVAAAVARLRARHGDQVARVYMDGLFAQPAQQQPDPRLRTDDGRVAS